MGFHSTSLVSVSCSSSGSARGGNFPCGGPTLEPCTGTSCRAPWGGSPACEGSARMTLTSSAHLNRYHFIALSEQYRQCSAHAQCRPLVQTLTECDASTLGGMSVIRWALPVTPETFQETSSSMNEGLCPAQTFCLHLCASLMVADTAAWS